MAKQFKCDACNYETTDTRLLHRHYKTDKHIKNVPIDLTVAVKPTAVETGMMQMMAMMSQLITNMPNPVTKAIKPPPVPAIVKKQRSIDTFLNENCRDAMNITDFIDGIKCVEQDFVAVGHSSYINGISDIIIRGLLRLDIHIRPIHTTNISKKEYYVKDNGVWVIDASFFILRKQIDLVSKKVSDLIPAYHTKNVKGFKDDTASIDYMQMIEKVLGGNNTREYNEEGVIKSILPAVVIDARNY